MRHHQRGFTLIEIAIVLVIIGLLLGGVLKGQELINSARVKNMATDLRNISVFIYGYQDRFRRLPGDDPAANTRFVGGANATTGGTTGNGVIEGAWNSITLTEETALFWQHVRGANFATGSINFASVNDAAFPTNAAGGRVGVQSAIPIVGLLGTYYACSTGIPFEQAQQLDLMLDDGVGTAGSVRAVTVGTATNAVAGIPAAPAAIAYAAGAQYTVCMAF